MATVTIDEARLARIEARLQYLEDEAEIRHLISSYGPAVDSGSTDAAANLWSDDGVYRYWTFMHDGLVEQNLDQHGIRGMLDGPHHQALIREGAAHTLGPARIDISGDTAIATNYSVILRRIGMSIVMYRMAANRWELVRTEKGWRARLRTARLLDGTAEARALLGAAFSSPA